MKIKSCSTFGFVCVSSAAVFTSWPPGCSNVIATRKRSFYLRLDEPLMPQAEPVAEPGAELVIKQVMRAFLKGVF